MARRQIFHLWHTLRRAAGHATGRLAAAGPARMGICRPRRRLRAMWAYVLILAAHYDPPIAPLLQLISHRHSLSRICSFGREGNRGVGFSVIHCERGHLHVHGPHVQIQIAPGEIIQHALTDGVFAGRSTIAGSERCHQEKRGGDSHYSIIAAERKQARKSVAR